MDIAARAALAGVPTTSAFFDRETAGRLRDRNGPADIITACNVFAHIDGLESAALAVRSLLAPGGVFVFEVSYVLDVVQRVTFDSIYHEHLSYHAVRPLRRFFARLGMTLFDVERVPAQGGSIRCYVARAPAPCRRRWANWKPWRPLRDCSARPPTVLWAGPFTAGGGRWPGDWSAYGLRAGRCAGTGHQRNSPP